METVHLIALRTPSCASYQEHTNATQPLNPEMASNAWNYRLNGLLLQCLIKCAKGAANLERENGLAGNFSPECFFVGNCLGKNTAVTKALRLKPIQQHLMRVLLFIPVFLAISGCARTEDVDRRKAGEPWYYYGDLLNFYRDENHGSPVALVWREQVQVQTVDRTAFHDTVKALIAHGYNKIGFVAVRSPRPIYPEDVTGLAADRGAQIVVASSFPSGSVQGETPVIDQVVTGRLGQQYYVFGSKPVRWVNRENWFQLLGTLNPNLKPLPTPPPPQISPSPLPRMRR